MSFLKKRLQSAEAKLAKALHTTYEPEVREQQVIYYTQQVEDIKRQMMERGES